MVTGNMLWLLFGGIFLVSLIWAFWSLRDLNAPQNFYPRFEKKLRKMLSGVIELPKKQS